MPVSAKDIDILLESRKRNLISDEEFRSLAKETIDQFEKDQNVLTPQQTAIRKFAEAATGGLITPVTARIETLGEAGAQLFRPKEERKPFLDILKEREERLQRQSAQAEKERPFLSLVSKTAGFATPGGIFGKTAGITTKTLGGIGVRKGISGLAGVGVGGGTLAGAEAISKGERLKNVARDILDGMALALGLGIGGEAVAIGGKGVASGIRKGGKRLLSSLRQIRPESVSLYAQNPRAVNQAVSGIMNGEFIPSFRDSTVEQIKAFVRSTNQELDEIIGGIDDLVDIRPLIKVARDQVSKLTRLKTTPLKERQANELIQQVQLLNKLPQKMPARDVQQIKKDLQEQLVSFFQNTKVKQDTLSLALEEIQKASKTMLEGLDKRIGPLNKKLEQGIKLQKKLGMGSVFREQGFDDRKAGRLLSTLVNESKKDVFLAAKELDRLAGTRIVSSAQLFKAAQELGKSDVISASQTGRSLLGGIFGTGLGSAVGSPGLGGLLGVLAGSPALTRPVITTGRGITSLLERGAGLPARPPIQRGAIGLLRESLQEHQ